MNAFQELDLVDRVSEELWAEIHNTARGSDQNHPQEKDMQQDKVVI